MLYEFTLVASVVHFLLELASPTYAYQQLTVAVGSGANNRFEPQFVSADKGDSVLFVFSQEGNYSVMQSSFDRPCQKTSRGFDSGLIPVSSQSSPRTAEYAVNSSDPVWFCSRNYCKSGMVFAINPSNSFTNFQQIAMGLADASTSSTTVTATSTVVVPGSGTATSTLVTLSLVPTATADTSSNSNGAGRVKHRTDIVTAMSIGIGLQLTALYYPWWW